MLCHYSKLKEDAWGKFSSDAYFMMEDLDAAVDAALKEKYPLYYDLVIYKIDGEQNIEIQELLEQKHGIKHSVEYISSLWRNKIPKLIAEKAQEDYLVWYYTNVEYGVSPELEERLKELSGSVEIDESRIATEICLFADKSTIDEEIIRLNSHIEQVRQTLELREPVGRKLDFIVQEMNRETNTIGSKANNLEITNGVIDIKTELENIREQVQNIE